MIPYSYSDRMAASEHHFSKANNTSQLVSMNQGNSQDQLPFGEGRRASVVTFSNGDRSPLASPSSAYSPRFFYQRDRSNSPPHSGQNLLNTFPSQRDAYPDSGLLSPSLPSPAVRVNNRESLNRAESYSSEHLSTFSPNAEFRSDFDPSSSRALGTSHVDSYLSTSENQESILNYLRDQAEPPPGAFRFSVQEAQENLDSAFHSSTRSRNPMNSDVSRNNSQNSSFAKRLSLMPPPEPIEVPTAEDVRFGIKGAKSAGWAEVRRQSLLRQQSSNSSSSKKGWRQSIFGNHASAEDVDDKSKAESLNMDVSFGELQETLAIDEELYPQNPYANFMRPMSVASDQNFTMIRADKTDANLSRRRFIPNLKNSDSMASLNAVSVISGTGPDSHNQLATSGMQEDISIKEKDDKRFDFLPYNLYNLDEFDFRGAEFDDALHDPGPSLPRKGADRMIIETKVMSGKTDWLSIRGWLNAMGLGILAVTLVSLFAGFPVIDYFIKHPVGTLGGFNLGGINATGQVPEIMGFRGLIDVDTPQSARTKQGTDGEKYRLVFSDEFNQENRSFWPGHDPYWEAVDLHYWATNNLEWYDPDQITTQNGSLVITLEKADNPTLNHDLDYKGGMLQSWNKFCFTGGIIEASISLPGDPKLGGMWPAFWTMGNLGRAGYGASLDGTWPYSYDSCDVGTLPNQTDPKTGGPKAAHTTGDPYHDNELSYLPGQRFSRCTCPTTSGKNYHPGPKHSDGTWVGRSAPEIDVFEAITNEKTKMGQVSHSAQLAPYNANYELNNRTEGYVNIYDNPFQTILNPYTGNIYQQAASGLSNTDQTSYNGNAFASYGFEYAPSDSQNPFITWTQKDQAMWQITPGAIGSDPVSQIGPRIISNEPMYIILNLGISANFGAIDLTKLALPAKLKVDWVRVYQPVDTPINTNCSPDKYPTAQYIQDHQPAYTNPNLTTWIDYQKSVGDNSGNVKTGFPKNKLLDTC